MPKSNYRIRTSALNGVRFLLVSGNECLFFGRFDFTCKLSLRRLALAILFWGSNSSSRDRNTPTPCHPQLHRIVVRHLSAAFSRPAHRDPEPIESINRRQPSPPSTF